MHRTKVKVVEDALDANNTIAQANRARLRPRRRARRQPDERARARARRRCSSASLPRARRRARRRARGRRPGLAWTPTGSPRLHVPVDAAQHRRRASAASATSTRTWCARRCRRSPLDEIDLLVIENVGNLVCPAEFRVGEDARVMVCSVDRGRGQAAQVPADVPHLRARRRQQDRPAPAPRLRPRALPAQPRRGQPRRRAHARCSARTGEGVEAFGATGSSRLRGAGGAPRLDRVAARQRRLGRACSRRGPRPTALLRARGRATSRGCCHRMAERFARGGRLVALGRSPGGALGRRATSRSSSSTR